MCKEITMAQITEDYVSFETAKLLKEKGFDEETAYAYSNNGELLRLNHFGIKDLTNTDCNGYATWQFPIEGVASIISAPTFQMAMKWLREVHNIAINIGWGEILEDIFQWWCIILDQKDGRVLRESEYHNTYEEACEAAIKYCLENLI